MDPTTMTEEAIAQAQSRAAREGVECCVYRYLSCLIQEHAEQARRYERELQIHPLLWFAFGALAGPVAVFLGIVAVQWFRGVL